MSLPKKRKISAPDSEKLVGILVDTITFEDEEEGESQSPDFSSLDGSAEELAKLDIMLTGFLCRKRDFAKALAATTSLGENEHWSSKGFHRHLQLLANTIAKPDVKKASIRAWIDSFFYRMSAMLPKEKRMVLNIENYVPSATVNPSHRLSGYIAVVANADRAAPMLDSPNLSCLKTCVDTGITSTGFFIVEVRSTSIPVLDSVPQAICEMFAYGKYIQKKVIRGALTNGFEWIFLILNINDDFVGTTYKLSEVIGKDLSGNIPNGLERVLGSLWWADFVVAILLRWVNNSFADLEGDDWLEGV